MYFLSPTQQHDIVCLDPRKSINGYPHNQCPTWIPLPCFPAQLATQYFGPGGIGSSTLFWPAQIIISKQKRSDSTSVSRGYHAAALWLACRAFPCFSPNLTVSFPTLNLVAQHLLFWFFLFPFNLALPFNLSPTFFFLFFPWARKMYSAPTSRVAQACRSESLHSFCVEK